MNLNTSVTRNIACFLFDKASAIALVDNINTIILCSRDTFTTGVRLLHSENNTKNSNLVFQILQVRNNFVYKKLIS